MDPTSFFIQESRPRRGQFDADGNLLAFVPGGGTGSIIFQNGGDGIKRAELTSLYAVPGASAISKSACALRLFSNILFKGQFLQPWRCAFVKIQAP